MLNWIVITYQKKHTQQLDKELCFYVIKITNNSKQIGSKSIEIQFNLEYKYKITYS